MPATSDIPTGREELRTLRKVIFYLRVTVPVYGVFSLALTHRLGDDPVSERAAVFEKVRRKCLHKKPGRLEQTGEFDFVFHVGPYLELENSNAAD